MPVYFSQDQDGRGTALWHATDDGPGVYCCGVDLGAYHNAPRVSALFADLVAAVADHFRRVHAVEAVAPTSRLAGWPCETCQSLEGQELRSRVGQLSSAGEIPLSPGGLPLNCCRVQALAAFGRPDEPRPAARR